MSEEYEIGYGKPPRHTQFPKGQSGNPKGRAKGTKNLKADLMEELRERIPITESGRRRTVSKQRAILKMVIAEALKGHIQATNVILNMLHRWSQDEPAQQTDRDLTRADKAILKRFEDEVLQKARDGEDGSDE
jgi:hypothetical protein